MGPKMSAHQPGRTNALGSNRSRELRRHLAGACGLEEGTVSAALMILIGSIHDRLSHSVEVSLVSWIPETWGILTEDGRDLFGSPPRGLPAMRRRLMDAGVPEEQTGVFIVELLHYLERRCSSTLAASLRRRIPEFVQCEQEQAPASML